jgi:hypothetical protein
MALRRNPKRGCQEVMLPPSFASQFLPPTTSATKVNTNVTNREREAPRRRKPFASKPRRRTEKALLHQRCQPANDKPFPFFELPQEIRDQVYSSLVVRQHSSERPIIAAATLLQDRKRRITAQANRERLNRKRALKGQPLTRTRIVESEPVLELNLLQASQRLNVEAKDCLYTNNWFAITLSKLPLTTFETPYGWDLSRITRLQLELQMKDAAHMNSYIDWATFFASFPCLRFLRVVFTFHPRYYDWALPELCQWAKTQYIHRAFFRDLLASIPGYIRLTVGLQADAASDLQLQGKVVSEGLVGDMYAELATWRATIT